MWSLLAPINAAGVCVAYVLIWRRVCFDYRIVCPTVGALQYRSTAHRFDRRLSRGAAVEPTIVCANRGASDNEILRRGRVAICAGGEEQTAAARLNH
jgi:hypothetical protein